MNVLAEESNYLNLYLKEKINLEFFIWMYQLRAKIIFKQFWKNLYVANCVDFIYFLSKTNF